MTERRNRFVEQPEDIDTMITILPEKKKATEKPKDLTEKPNTVDTQSLDSKKPIS
ncbi:MAG: hypothetical protein PUP93_33180 [Rhizonema sp. NSF051]|nr:hypothetical protein [Rhizonema sp. NSF051]